MGLRKILVLHKRMPTKNRVMTITMPYYTAVHYFQMKHSLCNFAEDVHFRLFTHEKSPYSVGRTDTETYSIRYAE